MNIFSPKLVGGLIAILAVGAVSAAAQSKIHFSVPMETNQNARIDSVGAAYRTQKKLSAGAYNAPIPVLGKLGAGGSFDLLPGSVSYDSAADANARQWKQFLDGKKNWTLMTPEEILGVQTPEKILGMTDAKDNQKLSTEEKFLARQSHPTFDSATNRMGQAADFWSVNSASELFGRRDEFSNLQKINEGTEPYAARGYNPADKTMNATLAGMQGQASHETVGNPFGLPAAAPKVTQDQLNAMTRFHDLLEPGSPSEKPAVTSSYSALGAAPASLSGASGGNPNSLFLAAPPENRAGKSFQSLLGDVSKPTGITPLPGITQIKPPVAKKLASQPKLPPWLTDSLTPFKSF